MSDTERPIEFKPGPYHSDQYGSWVAHLSDNEYFGAHILQNAGAVGWSLGVANSEIADAVLNLEEDLAYAILGTPVEPGAETLFNPFKRHDVAVVNGKVDPNAFKDDLSNPAVIWAKLSINKFDYFALDRREATPSTGEPRQHSLFVYGSVGFEGDNPARMFGTVNENGELTEPGIVRSLLLGTATPLVVANVTELIASAREHMDHIVANGNTFRATGRTLGGLSSADI